MKMGIVVSSGDSETVRDASRFGNFTMTIGLVGRG